MSKTLILCEKPSQAADFAKGLGESFKRDSGYYESPSYIICHARGHLVTLAEPEDYDPSLKSWKMDSLPIIPQEFEYKVEADDRGALFKTISKKLNRKDVAKIVVATDAEREGELIARLIFKMAGIGEHSGKQLYRFWTSAALTPAEIKKTMASLKPLSDYDRLYHAAMARQQADWLIGINGTRAATVKANAGGKGSVVSIGRVQTPTLFLLASRTNEIEHFVPQKYYEVSGDFRSDSSAYSGMMIDQDGKIVRIDSLPTANAAISSLMGMVGEIISVEKTKQCEKPPQLYSLSGVQKEANSKYGIRASETREHLQSLYDKKFTTYPRSGSVVLEEQMVSIASATLKALGANGADISRCKVDAGNKCVFNNAQLTDHHAIIPTGTKPHGLSANETLVYELVLKRFVAAFSPDYLYEATVIATAAGDYTFKTTGNRTLDLGWKAVFGISEKETSLPAVKKGDKYTLTAKLLEKVTTAPKPYTDATLLADMESAHKFVKDENLKKLLKENSGIGTPATQASIIDTLIKRGYAELKGKSIIVTDAGRKLIEEMKTEQVCDVGYTAVWEQSLEDIASGRLKGSKDFMDATIASTKYLIAQIKQKNLSGVSKMEEAAESLGKCPVCGGDVIEFQKGYSCTNKENCKFVLWKNKLSFAGKAEITPKDAKGLLLAHSQSGHAELKLKSKAGDSYTAPVALSNHPQYGWGVKILRRG